MGVKLLAISGSVLDALEPGAQVHAFRYTTLFLKSDAHPVLCWNGRNPRTGNAISLSSIDLANIGVLQIFGPTDYIPSKFKTMPARDAA